jgi:hypothetical protein
MDHDDDVSQLSGAPLEFTKQRPVGGRSMCGENKQEVQDLDAVSLYPHWRPRSLPGP